MSWPGSPGNEAGDRGGPGRAGGVPQGAPGDAVERLAAGVAHEFNNILQLLQSGLDALDREAISAADRRSILEDLRARVQRGSLVARELLVFAGREKPRKEPVELNELLRRSESLLGQLLPREIRLRFALDPCPLPIRADPTQLRQVLISLVENAAEAMPEGGEIAVESGTEGGQHAWLAVRDQGAGIVEGYEERIFEPFYTTKGGAERPGLGLATVRAIVEAHGGRIEVESRPGEGSTFRVLLAREEERAVPGPPPSAEAPPERRPEGPLRILLVEDHAPVRRMLERMLQGLGYEVLAAGSGEAARELAKESPLDLLLTDVMLPGETGIDLARSLRRELPRLPVVLLTGSARDDFVLGEGLAGARFLSKPIAMADLQRELERAVGGNGGR